ncbi:selenide, water dikinase [Toxoplasma gondii MAS]|uniref:Selenide, water dikinase n=1 Tax=Toxoplasma gondii MAS TaxID=943118 RepID=A0A086PTS7_TOXGO|nr:selenide, water dikinase [Toxoplasma gondii MAS]
MKQSGRGGCSGQGARSISRDLVLVGGGSSHLFVMKDWAKQPEKGMRLTLVSADTDTPYKGLLPGLLAGAYTRDQAHVDLLQLCQVAGGRFVRASVLGVDRERKLIFCDDGRPPLRYDVLSVDTESGLSAPGSITFSSLPPGEEQDSSISSPGQQTDSQEAFLDLGDRCMRACIAPLRPLSQFLPRWEAALGRLVRAALYAWTSPSLAASEAATACDSAGADPESKPTGMARGTAEAHAAETVTRRNSERAGAVSRSRVFTVAFVGGGTESVEICFAARAAVEKKLADLHAHWRTLRRDARTGKGEDCSTPRDLHKERDAQPAEVELCWQRESEELSRLFRVEFHLFTEGDSVLPGFSSGAQTRVSRLLKAGGVSVHTQWKVASVRVETAPRASQIDLPRKLAGPLQAAQEGTQTQPAAAGATACAEASAAEASLLSGKTGTEAELECESFRKRLLCSDGRHFEFDECVWCTPATPQSWFQNTGLELTPEGFLAVDASLRSCNAHNVFAVGEAAKVRGTESRTDGDDAGETLSRNLRLVLRNGDSARLHRWRSQSQLFSVVSCGENCAVGVKGHISFEGKWVSNLRTRMDIDWIQKYQVSPSGLLRPSLLSSKSLTAPASLTGGLRRFLSRGSDSAAFQSCETAGGTRGPSSAGGEPNAEVKGDVTRSSSGAHHANTLGSGASSCRTACGKSGVSHAECIQTKDEVSLGCRVLMEYVQASSGARGRAPGCKSAGGTRCGGCGAKVPSTVLRRTMQELEQADAAQTRQHRVLMERERGASVAAETLESGKDATSLGAAPGLRMQPGDALQLAALQKRIDKEGRFYPLLFNRSEVLLGLEDADDGCVFAAKPVERRRPTSDKESDGVCPGRSTTLANDPCVEALGGDNPLLIQTVDFYRAFFDDAFVLGRIAATHAMSDCYAMGAEPLVALLTAVVPYSTDCIMANNLLQLLGGCCSALSRDRCQLAGGHSAQGRDMAAGLTITGRLSRLRKSQRPESDSHLGVEGDIHTSRVEEPIGYLPKGSAEAQEGDVLILTKPLGTGVIMAGHVEGKSRGRWVYDALDLMQVSNRAAAEILMDCGATACTDVTGFGLLGHMLEMLRACRKSRILAAVAAADKKPVEARGRAAGASSSASSSEGIADSSSGEFVPLVCARLMLPSLRLLDGVTELMNEGIHSSLLASNARYFPALSLKTVGTAPAGAAPTGDLPIQPLSPADLPPTLPILFDPQTSGGLLAFVPANKATECIRRLREEGGYDNAMVIGSIFERKTFVPFPQKDAAQETRSRYAPWENVAGAVECLH